VARLARDLGKAVVGVAGHISADVRQSGLFEICAALNEYDLPLETLMSEAGPLLTRKVRELSGLLPLHGGA
jgi:hypothetical protein